MITDVLRPPALFDPTAPAYKDWLHLNLFDHASGLIGIFNASLHGNPRDRRSRAVGAALVHDPAFGWAGNLEVLDLSQARVDTCTIGLERVAVGTDPQAGVVFASARLGDDGVDADLKAIAATRPIDVSVPLPFGSGWISWYVVPRLSVSGTLRVAASERDLSNAIAYHDHNWGRWHWGEDVGWKWGAGESPSGIVVVFMSTATTRTHASSSGGTLLVDAGAERRLFSGSFVRFTYTGRFTHPVRRLPGALAALHQDRRLPALPGKVVVEARDGFDDVELVFEPRAAAQLIAGDPMQPGYGFVHEMVGSFEASGRLEGRRFQAAGLAVFEHVD